MKIGAIVKAVVGFAAVACVGATTGVVIANVVEKVKESKNPEAEKEEPSEEEAVEIKKEEIKESIETIAITTAIGTGVGLIFIPFIPYLSIKSMVKNTAWLAFKHGTLTMDELIEMCSRTVDVIKTEKEAV